MYEVLNPDQRQEIADELTSREELVVLQAEYAHLLVELKKSQKKEFFWKAIVISFVAFYWFVFVMNQGQWKRLCFFCNELGVVVMEGICNEM